MSDCQTLMSRLQQRFDPEAAGTLAAVFHYRVNDSDHQLRIDQGACILESGPPEEADATLTLEADTLCSLLDGELDGMAAFMSGQLKVGGDMMLAMRLTELFPTP